MDAARGVLGNDWPAVYHASPTWRFAMPAGICGDAAWVGVLGPASDRVGRCFPMVIAAPLNRSEAVTQALLQGDHWFDTLARVHARAQADPSIHAEAFDGLVADVAGPGSSDPIAAPQPPQPLDLVYERAFLCAMPRDMWPRVVQRWAQLLPAGALLLGYFFFDNNPKGPPFGADREQLAQLMSAHFDLEQDDPVEDSIPVFQGKERWMAWRRKKAL